MSFISKLIFKYFVPTELKREILKSPLQKKLENSILEETHKNFYKYFKTSLLLNSKHDVRKYSIKKSVENSKDEDYFLEFGCYKGTSANFFSKYVKKIYTFDSFEGLKEDWKGREYSKGFFSLNKEIPNLNSNVEPIVGWVEDTLESFLKKHNPKIRFVHLDLDTYSPTKFTLEKIKPYLQKNSYILFDDYFNFVGWDEGEFKALKETFNEDEYEYKAFNIGKKSTRTLFECNNCLIQIK